ncbi:MAG TPA: RNA polymerase sigma factor [Terriglobia bacterium]|nr:RNA polymerase sigma factor [Terriglobia bacterium]
MGATTYLFSALMPDDAREIERGLRQRDPDLLDRLIEQYQYRLYRYLLFLTANRETAEDLFQETWVRVLDRGHQYNGKAKFETWLFSIARHLVIDALRRRRPESLDELMDPAEGQEGRPAREFAAGEPGPAELFAQGEEGERVAAALGELPSAHREVLLLRFQEDLGLEEIAGVAAAPLSTVKSRLYRGLEQLRGLLEEPRP